MSAVRIKYSSRFGLINIFMLVSFDYLLEREGVYINYQCVCIVDYQGADTRIRVYVFGEINSKKNIPSFYSLLNFYSAPNIMLRIRPVNCALSVHKHSLVHKNISSGTGGKTI